MTNSDQIHNLKYRKTYDCEEDEQAQSQRVLQA